MSKPAKRCRQLNLLDFFPQKRNKIEEIHMTTKAMEDKNSEEIPKLKNRTDETEVKEILVSAAVERQNADQISDATAAASEENEETLVSGESQPDHLSDSLNGSEELFADLYNSEECSPVPVPSEEKNEAILKLNHWPECRKILPPFQPSDKHTILFNTHIIPGCSPRPYPDTYRDRWDPDYVRMPCSPLNRYPVASATGEKTIQSRWEVICNALNGHIKSSIDLENAIMQYNRQYLGKWDFRGLHTFINQHLDEDHKLIFFEFILPGMIDLALSLPNTCTKPIPLLKKYSNHAITMSQKQIACLLANAFFCTFPRRNRPSRFHAGKFGGEYSNYPDINFNRLYTGTKNGVSLRNCEKLKCILNYFSSILQEEPKGAVTFHRQCPQAFPNWSASAKTVNEVVICSKGLIEDEGQGMLQIDFANRFVGGGVLGQGCIQEEIRFVISPELIISRLFTECLADTEALIVTGIQQYSKYKGYGDTFQFDGNFKDNMPSDEWGRRYTQIVAIDALHFNKSSDQFKISLIKRELNKAYAGFYEAEAHPRNLVAVATGNWGCGAFRGSPYLKFLIQLMAASVAGRDMLYFSFGNDKLQEDLQKMYEFVKAENFRIGDLWNLLEVYCSSAMQTPEERRPSLYDYIYSTKHSDSATQEEKKTSSMPAAGPSKSNDFVWPIFT